MGIEKMFNMLEDEIPKERKKKELQKESILVETNLSAVVLPDIPYNDPVIEQSPDTFGGALIGAHLGVFLSEMYGKDLLHKALIILPCAVSGYVIDNYIKRKSEE